LFEARVDFAVETSKLVHIGRRHGRILLEKGDGVSDVRPKCDDLMMM
jgi:hypothetical protein